MSLSASSATGIVVGGAGAGASAGRGLVPSPKSGASTPSLDDKVIQFEKFIKALEKQSKASIEYQLSDQLAVDDFYKVMKKKSKDISSFQAGGDNYLKQNNYHTPRNYAANVASFFENNSKLSDDDKVDIYHYKGGGRGEKAYTSALSGGIHDGLSVVLETKKMGLGVIATKGIIKGTILGEYTGEVSVARSDASSLYVWTLFRVLDTEYILDAQDKGNILRFMNSDKERPNVASQMVFADGELRIIYYAVEDIKAGEFMHLNYHGESDDSDDDGDDIGKKYFDHTAYVRPPKEAKSFVLDYAKGINKSLTNAKKSSNGRAKRSRVSLV